MDIFSKLFSSLFLFQSLLALLFPLAAAQNSNLFREYIGAQDKGVKFTDVPINPDVEFHFILAFAIDYTNPTSPTDGIFNIFWDNVNLSASAVSSIKQSNSNVKVALSLGGYTVDGSDTNVTFHPTSVDTWVDNAVSSLTTIIQQYNLDGIDIDYERFNDGTDPDTFAECIGRLLTTLKSNGVIEFASIAPYLEPLESYYKALWGKYSELIDYVNFQFYGYPAGMTVSEFLSSYETQRTNYDGGKVLASFISDGSLGLSPQNGFFDACETLQSKGELPGIVVWSADTSKNTGNGFQYEKQAQELLANAN